MHGQREENQQRQVGGDGPGALGLDDRRRGARPAESGGEDLGGLGLAEVDDGDGVSHGAPLRYRTGSSGWSA
ncbi:hypothetical protein Adi01nite_13330 [Amorphoplanes digitatis]|nr:hypothetical protein GCM10020092_047470 [Actinoplanes digitatis]GID91921.1 hypothetical protein Adi01nite_13330 [Actinoplanes digitatis]